MSNNHQHPQPQGLQKIVNVDKLIYEHTGLIEIYDKHWSQKKDNEPYRPCDVMLLILAKRIYDDKMYEQVKDVAISEVIRKEMLDIFLYDPCNIVTMGQWRLFQTLNGFIHWLCQHPYATGRCDRALLADVEKQIHAFRTVFFRYLTKPFSSDILDAEEYTNELDPHGKVIKKFGNYNNIATITGSTGVRTLESHGLTEADYYSDKEKSKEVLMELKKNVKSEWSVAFDQFQIRNTTKQSQGPCGPAAAAAAAKPSLFTPSTDSKLAAIPLAKRNRHELAVLDPKATENEILYKKPNLIPKIQTTGLVFDPRNQRYAEINKEAEENERVQLKQQDEEDDEGCLRPSNMKETTRRASMNFIHDMHWMFYDLDLHFKEALGILRTAVDMTNSTLLHSNKFRDFAINRVKQMSDGDMYERRKEWHMKHICLESDRVIYARKTRKKLSRVATAAAIGFKLKNYYDYGIPKTLSEMFKDPVKDDPASPDIDPVQWKRTNTDFLFYLCSSMETEKGDCYEYTIRTKMIKWIRVLNKWTLNYNNQVYLFDSFLFAFTFLRQEMTRRRANSKVLMHQKSGRIPDIVDLSQFDNYICL